MSGLGRRTHYRKHLTDAVLNNFPEPAQNERIAKVVSTRGSNQFDLIVAPKDPCADIETTPQLAILPTKFRKLVWLKRNDYVICSCVEDDENDRTTDGIKHMIEHILYKEQIKHLKEKGLWPKHSLFADAEELKQSDNEIAVVPNQDKQGNDTVSRSDDESVYSQSDDGIIYNDEHDDTYYCNMNRIAKLKVEDSSDEDSEED